MAILTELPEITDTLFTPNKALLKAIADAEKWIEYFIISDFPDETPKKYPPLSFYPYHFVHLLSRLMFPLLPYSLLHSQSLFPCQFRSLVKDSLLGK